MFIQNRFCGLEDETFRWTLLNAHFMLATLRREQNDTCVSYYQLLRFKCQPISRTGTPTGVTLLQRRISEVCHQFVLHAAEWRASYFETENGHYPGLRRATVGKA
jgi:hypothetical protein